jgi:hypothetical protein
VREAASDPPVSERRQRKGGKRAPAKGRSYGDGGDNRASENATPATTTTVALAGNGETNGANVRANSNGFLRRPPLQSHSEFRIPHGNHSAYCACLWMTCVCKVRRRRAYRGLIHQLRDSSRHDQ